MLNFPKSTQYGKKIPKEKFYSKLEVSSAMKRNFVNDIDQIVWRNKLSASTINISSGSLVIEIDVLEISLKKKECNYSLFEFIDKNLPNHTVFILTYSNEVQLFITYKEAIDNRVGRHKIAANYKTDWLPQNEMQLNIDGLNLDRVYDNFVVQIANEKLAIEAHSDLKQAIVSAQEIERLQKEITALESKIRNETQFNIQVKLSTKLKALKKKLKKSGIDTFE